MVVSAKRTDILHNDLQIQTMDRLYIVLILALYCISKTKCSCGKYQYCTLLDWQSWEACKGQCGGITEQVRKRSVCVETSKIQPFTVENVIAYCKFTEPLSEKKVCPQCPHGIFNASTSMCDYCSKYGR